MFWKRNSMTTLMRYILMFCVGSVFVYLNQLEHIHTRQLLMRGPIADKSNAKASTSSELSDEMPKLNEPRGNVFRSSLGLNTYEPKPYHRLTVETTKRVQSISTIMTVNNTSKPVQETSELLQETSRPTKKISNPANETSKLDKETSEQVQETSNLTMKTSNPANETSNLVQETSKYVREISEPINEMLKQKVDRILSEIPFTDENLLPRCYKPITNFVYIKNHKCGSDTVAAIFRRFGYLRNLSLVLPVALYWNVGWPFRLEPHMYRTPKSGYFNILTEHTTYDEERLSKLMPDDAQYITSLREPYDRLKSVFQYFIVAQFTGIDKIVKPRSSYVNYFLKSENKTGLDEAYKSPNQQKVCVPPGLSVMRNAMSFELGLPVGFHTSVDMQDDIDYIKKWLQHIDSRFTMVLLLEYFSHSLVMLKRMMCWTAKDVLFRRLNTKRPDAKPGKFNHYGDPTIESFLSWSFADTLLYAHFNNTLWRRINIMGAGDFNAEVEDFEGMRDETVSFCKGALNITVATNDPPKPKLEAMQEFRPLIFRQTKWNPDIVITREDCEMLFSETDMRDELRDRYKSDPREVEQPKPPGKLVGC